MRPCDGPPRSVRRRKHRRPRTCASWTCWSPWLCLKIGKTVSQRIDHNSLSTRTVALKTHNSRRSALLSSLLGTKLPAPKLCGVVAIANKKQMYHKNNGRDSLKKNGRDAAPASTKALRTTVNRPILLDDTNRFPRSHLGCFKAPGGGGGVCTTADGFAIIWRYYLGAFSCFASQQKMELSLLLTAECCTVCAAMPKRKADEDKKTQDVVRPPAPSASNDDEDSDFCDIIEGPIATPGTAVPQGIPPQRSVVASPLVPAARANPQLPFAAAHSHHDPNNAGVLSMLAGFSGAMPYIQPMHAAGFDFRQIPICQQRHSLEYGPPDILASQAPFQGRRYPPGPSLPRPVASPVASSSNGMSSGASSPGETHNMV